MIERRALERIEIKQPAMLQLDGVRGIYGTNSDQSRCGSAWLALTQTARLVAKGEAHDPVSFAGDDHL